MFDQYGCITPLVSSNFSLVQMKTIHQLQFAI